MRGSAAVVVLGLLAAVGAAWWLARRRSSVSITESGLGSIDGEHWFGGGREGGSVLDEVLVTVKKLPEVVTDALAPLGVRQRNPMHVRATSTQWQGEVAGQGGYEWFATDEDGIRAGARTLLNYQRIHGLRTVAQIITRYAPNSENPTDAYIANVADWLGVRPDAQLDLEDQALMRRLVRAVIRQEVGPVWSAKYSDELIARAVARAYS